jgi:hypothetical protein
MKTAYAASIALAIAALSTGYANAADVVQGKTRDQVRAELAEAQRTGDIAASKDVRGDEFAYGAGRTLNELFPASYPAKPAATGKTRAQVLAELAEARRTGDIAASKDAASDEFTTGAGRKLNELYPASYPGKTAETGKTRAQVQAELSEARRTGDIVASKDVGVDEYTASTGRKLNELFPNAYPATATN